VLKLQSRAGDFWTYKLAVLARSSSAAGSRAWLRAVKCESAFKTLSMKRETLQSREDLWIREQLLRMVLVVQDGWAVGSLCREPESARLCQLLQ